LDPAQGGYGLGVSVSGDTVIGGNGSQAAVFLGSGGAWTPQSKWSDSYMDSAVAIDADTAIVGAPEAALSGPESGSAYVYVRNGSTWTFQALLVPPAPAMWAHFGAKVAVKGDIAVVSSFTQGAFVYVRNGATWSFEQALGGPISSSCAPSVAV